MRLNVTPDSYNQPTAKQFVEDMLDAGLEPFHYHGKFFFEGPAVVVPDIQIAIRATPQEVQWDCMGLEYVVYSRKSASLKEIPNEVH